jgi:hypothetical protein
MFERLKKILNLKIEQKKSLTPEQLIDDDFIEDGKAIVDVNLTTGDEIFSTFSNRKMLNPEILKYIDEITDPIPLKFPIVLNFIVDDPSKVDQKRIQMALNRYYWLSFKKKQKELRKESIASLLMLTAGLGIIMFYSFITIPEFFFAQEMMFLVSWILSWEGAGHFLVGMKDKVKDVDDEEQLALAEITFEERKKNT